MSGKYIIGIDAGTSKTKAILFDQAGNELCVAGEPTNLLTPGPGLVEQDMNEVWDSCYNMVKQLLEKSDVNRNEVAAIAITGQEDGTWNIGKDGEPVANSINWTDGRGVDICTKLIEAGADKAIYAASNNTFYAGSRSVLLMWLLQNDKEQLDKAEYIGGCKDWLKFKFTGVFSGDTSYLVGNSGTRQRDEVPFGGLGLGAYGDKVASARKLKDAFDPILPELAKDLGLNEGTPVFGGPFDFVACAIGSGTLNYGDACAILGTTTNLSFAVNEFDPEPFNVGYNLCCYNDNQWIRAFGVMAGTPNIEWTIGHMGLKYILAAKEKGTNVYAEIDEAIKDIPPGSNGLIYHPYALPGGERSPFVKPTAKANFFGLGVEHTTDHLVHAVYEGIGYSLLDCMKCRPEKPQQLTIMGGGANSPVLCQILSDITGVDIVVTAGSEFGAKGAAMAAATSIGMFPTIEDAKAAWVHEVKRFKPDLEKTAKYEKLFVLYKEICNAMFDLWDKRAAILQEL